MSASLSSTVVWVLDPFLSNEDVNRGVGGVVKALAVGDEGSWTAIHAAYVLNPETALPLGWYSERTRDFALKARGGLPVEAHILIEHQSSLGASAESLIGFARKKRAVILVISSSGSKGLSKRFLGSFAETLVDVADSVAVLVMRLRCPQFRRIESVLFPMAFSSAADESRAAIVWLCRKLRAELLPYTQLSSSSWAPLFKVPRDISRSGAKR